MYKRLVLKRALVSLVMAAVVAGVALPAPASAHKKHLRVARCVVPNLKGDTLAMAKHKLKRAHCSLGATTGPRKGIVMRQSPRSGTRRRHRAKVHVSLRPRTKPPVTTTTASPPTASPPLVSPTAATTTTATTTTAPTTTTTATTTTVTTPLPPPPTVTVSCSEQNLEPGQYYTTCNADIGGLLNGLVYWTVNDQTLGESCTIPALATMESFDIANGTLSGYEYSPPGSSGSLCTATNLSPTQSFELQVAYAGDTSSNWLGLTLYNG